MSVIIGAGTTVVSTQFPNDGIVSVNFGFQPNVTRLYQLGSFTPYDSYTTRSRTLSVTAYGSKRDGTGGTAQHDVSPSTTCTDAGTINITINPASCVSSLVPFVDDYFVNSYSYQKDNLGFGQETWSMTTKPIISTYTGTIVMLRGIAEGTVSTGNGTMDPALQGIVVDDTASNDTSGEITGESGSVQAGSPGVGNYDITRYVVVTSIGGSIGSNSSVDGLSGNASVSIPLTPVYL